MDDLIDTPTVEAYAVLKQHERDTVARNLAHNARVLKKERDALLDREHAARDVRAQMIARAKAQARTAARAEVERIYQDTFTAERILAFETHPRTPAAHGDISACAAESHEWDVKHSTRRKANKTNAR